MSELALPASLELWRPWLSWFSQDAIELLGDLLRKLHPWLGHASGLPQGQKDEPDGVGDILQRGHYERLLNSEWLLADEFPEEFLRRAGSGEHLFLAPRRSAQRRAVDFRLLMDVGPLQFGAPRIVHLALLILLAQRAHQRRGRLLWATWQEPGVWHDVREPADLRRMLASRVHSAVTEEHVQRWLEHLSAQPQEVSEWWQVGAGGADLRVHTGSRFAYHLTIRRALFERQLDLHLRHPGGARDISLPIPNAQAGLRLIKGYFDTQEASSAHHTIEGSLSLRRNPLFSSDGHWVYLPGQEDREGTLCRTKLVGVGRPLARKRQQLPKGAEPLAWGYSAKSLGMLLHRGDMLAFWQVHPLAQVTKPPREIFNLPPGRRTPRPMHWQRRGHHVAAWVLDVDGRLICWRDRDNRKGTEVGIEAEDVLILLPQLDGRGLYGRRLGDDLQLCELSIEGRSTTSVIAKGPAGSWDGLFACGVRWGRVPRLNLAWGAKNLDGSCTWRVSKVVGTEDPQERSSVVFELSLASGVRVLGLGFNSDDGALGLVVLQADRRTVVWQGSDGQQTLYTTDSPVVQSALCPERSMLVLVTLNATAHMFSVSERKVHWVVHAGPGEEHHE